MDNLKLDPSKKDGAIIYLLAELIATQDKLIDIFLTLSKKSHEEQIKLREALFLDIKSKRQEVLLKLYEEFGQTPDV